MPYTRPTIILFFVTRKIFHNHEYKDHEWNENRYPEGPFFIAGRQGYVHAVNTRHQDRDAQEKGQRGESFEHFVLVVADDAFVVAVEFEAEDSDVTKVAEWMEMGVSAVVW